MFDQKQMGESTVMIRAGTVLDNSNAHKMTEVINAVQVVGNKYIILNMSDLNFISSAGVGSILGAIGTSREMGGDIVLCGLSDKILHVFEILDLCDYLTITSNESSATELCLTEAR